MINCLIRHILLTVGLLALPVIAWAQPMVHWDQEHRLPVRLGPFSLSSTRLPPSGDDNGTAVLHVSDTQGHKSDIKIEIAYDDVYATLGVGSIDPDSPGPQLLVTSYTGGAHCCVHIQILDLVDGQLRALDIGTFDGEVVSAFPTDIDGDGITDLQRWDGRFAYAFGCYACSWMPPRVFNVRGGTVQDTSAAPRYRMLYVKDFGRAKHQCLKHVNAACAGMVADGYRLGRADEAWSIAMANIDPDDLMLPGCKVKAVNGECPEDQHFHSGEFRAALMQFLTSSDIAPPVR